MLEPPYVIVVGPLCYYYSHCMCSNEVPCKWQIGGLLCCYTPVVNRYYHWHLPFLVLLLVHCVISDVASLLCCLCHGEVPPLPIALCKWWRYFMIGNREEKKKVSFSTCLFFIYLFIYFLPIFSFVLSYIYFCFVFFFFKTSNLFQKYIYF